MQQLPGPLWLTHCASTTFGTATTSNSGPEPIPAAAGTSASQYGTIHRSYTKSQPGQL